LLFTDKGIRKNLSQLFRKSDPSLLASFDHPGVELINTIFLGR
jgi:hypothetical protein